MLDGILIQINKIRKIQLKLLQKMNENMKFKIDFL